jgi:hypothetical protein
MPTINIAQLVEDTLVGTFTDQTGNTPEGVFIPDEKTIGQLDRAFSGDLHGMCKWLKLAAYAHMARTQLTKTPFYINSVLFAESSISFMEKHEKWLLNTYASGGVPSAFKNSVYRDIAWVEEEFITSCLLWSSSNEEALERAASLRPTVWWSVLSFDMRRMSSRPALTGTMTHDGVRGDARELVDAEIAALKEDVNRYNKARSTAVHAIQDTRIKVAARFRAASPLYLDGRITVTPDSLMGEGDFVARSPLAESDTLFARKLEFLSRRKVSPTVPREIVAPTPAQLRAVSLHDDA